MNKKILVSLAIIGVAAAITIGATTAFFSDTETSTGNTFTAGAIDLTIDNTCYYNGDICEYVGENGEGGYYWDGDPAKGACSCSWDLANLSDHLFFDFEDLKPGDHGEDTISFHVNSNDAWACANVTLTSAWENGITEPERKEDDTWGKWEGELDDELHFFFWGDVDGNNVYEPGEGEPSLMSGKASDLPQGDENMGRTFTLADSDYNPWAGGQGEPLMPGTEYYIGKIWCLGDLVEDEGTVECDGTEVGNRSQTDMLTGDISFYAVQARNNGDFKCSDWMPDEEEEGPIVEEGEADMEEGGGVRYKSFANTGSNEIYLGVDDLGQEDNRSEKGFTWASGSYDVSFVYDKANDKLVTTVDGETLEYPNFESNLTSKTSCSSVDDLDVMQISIANRDSGTEIDLNDVGLGSYDLGDFDGGVGNSGWHNWTVTGYDFTNGFTVDGELVLDGTFSDTDENCKVQISVGCSN